MILPTSRYLQTRQGKSIQAKGQMIDNRKSDEFFYKQFDLTLTRYQIMAKRSDSQYILYQMSQINQTFFSFSQI